MSGPLDGIRVLDLTRYVAGPHATQMLGDFGADVAKLEGLEGDGARLIDDKLGPGDSLFSLMFNRSKRSLAIDLRTEGGREMLTELAGVADVVVENFRPGVMESMGFGWDRLHAINPRLVMTRISGFGQDGPWAGRASYDPVIQALSGIQELTGQADGPPTVCGTIITDYLTGLFAVIGTVTALQARERTGEGQMVDVSMLEGATSLLMTSIPEYLLHGVKRTRRGNKNPISVPSHSFLCGDGRYVHITAWSDPEFAKLAVAMEMPDLPKDPRFNSILNRSANDTALEKIVGDWMQALTAEEAERRMLAQRLATARVATMDEVATNPQLQHRGHIIELDHPVHGKVPVAGPPMRFSGTPVDSDYRVPTLGQHSVELLTEWLDIDEARLEKLAADRVIGIAETG
ncbi:CaiB/BaiF CoA transferase family protein [Minwuia sp.]|uniref:CaiB/BaiF CoA transferase family protein n=1 Tax=Minwuia sp. TaxID=2493630 RepID=UPI003A957BC7